MCTFRILKLFSVLFLSIPRQCNCCSSTYSRIIIFIDQCIHNHRQRTNIKYNVVATADSAGALTYVNINGLLVEMKNERNQNNNNNSSSDNNSC